MKKEHLKERWGTGISDSNDNHPVPPNQKKAAEEHDESSDSADCYAISKQSNHLMSVLFKKRGGNLLYMPYSWQPSVEYIPEKGLFLKSLQAVIHITGRGLEPLAHAFGAQSVQWVEESKTGLDDKSVSTFIIDIEFIEPEP